MLGKFIDEECYDFSPGLAGANRLDNSLYVLAPITERKIALFLSFSVTHWLIHVPIVQCITAICPDLG